MMDTIFISLSRVPFKEGSGGNELTLLFLWVGENSKGDLDVGIDSFLRFRSGRNMGVL